MYIILPSMITFSVIPEAVIGYCLRDNIAILKQV